MSSYLVIKKNNTTLGEWSRSTQLYQACDGMVPFDKEEGFKPIKQFPVIIDNLSAKIKVLEGRKRMYKEMLPLGLPYHELFETLTTIGDIDEEIKEYESAMHDVWFMQNCYECDEYSEDEKNEWTWYIG